jgi:hypothetical protein
MWTKNVAITGFTFGLIHKVTGEPVTAGTAFGFGTVNGGVQTALTNTPVHEGNGQWSVNLTAAEMNGEVIGLAFTHSSAIPCYCNIRTDSGGANLVTITVTDDVDVPIPDVDVYAYDSSNTVFITSDKTNSSGTATIFLDNGLYKCRIKKAGVVFTNPETLTVSGDTIDTFVGSNVSIGVPDDSDSCRVYTYCYDMDGGDPLIRVTAYASIHNDPYYQDGKYHFSGKVIGTYNAASGLLYWDIAQGATARVEISEIGYKKTVSIPAQSSVLLSGL